MSREPRSFNDDGSFDTKMLLGRRPCNNKISRALEEDALKMTLQHAFVLTIGFKMRELRAESVDQKVPCFSHSGSSCPSTKIVRTSVKLAVVPIHLNCCSQGYTASRDGLGGEGEITGKDPLPRIDDTLESLREASIFSTMDMKSGYWKIEVDEANREKTAFVTPDGLFEFKVIPFGLCNAPATFERIIDNLLRGLKWTICLCYIDDIIVFF
ncbi:K02A2.6-like [Cordylochernes scorpioides]|uniref:K02A2.6-like n=1 Tax=Cordylochernes scorpioides TaxID=51811 RepID=A0ABY6L8M0_9ARAC|nr:K02A2.6-like [Cordylochernes scorpioides]